MYLTVGVTESIIIGIFMDAELQNTTLFCTLQFQKPVRIDNYPAFVVRGVLGYHLKKMHCVVHGTPCQECVFYKTCAYVFLFESIIDKDSPVLEGRDRASHPFRLVCHAEPNSVTNQIDLRVQLYGRATEYVPHILFALREAGKTGLFRERAPYQLLVQNARGEIVLQGNRIQESALVRDVIKFPAGNEVKTKQLLIHCNTPLRFKVHNQYNSDFSAKDFYFAAFRRIETLFSLYGTIFANTFIDITEPEELLLHKGTLVWKDYPRYSGRQKTVMMLGGVQGSFTLEGSAPQAVWQTFTTAGTLGVGKNTSFGFGDITVEETHND